MALLTWLAQVREVSADALTVRVQQLDPTLQNQLLWDQFFPPRDVDSTELDEILTEETEGELVGERREWDTRGRPIVVKSPKRTKLEFIPIESYFKIAEKEINDLFTRFRGNQALMRDQIGIDIPRRVDRLARVNVRRLEKDAFDLWSGGQITRRNQELGTLYTYNFNFDSTRYPTALVAWDDPSVNAYQEFLATIRAADKRIGRVGGAMMRQATWDVIEASATQAIAINFAPTVLMNREQVEGRLRSDLGGRSFTIVIFEDTLEVFNDGGVTNRSTVNRWPAETIGFIPQANGGAIGFTARAPVIRADALAPTTVMPDAGIDVRGQRVFYEAENGGRGLNTECQWNAFPVAFEDRLYVIDVGV